MNWLISHLVKEARERRFGKDDRVRYFTKSRKGKGGEVLTPSFSRGIVDSFDQDSRQYKVKSGNDLIDVHPRNIMHDPVSRVPLSPTSVSPTPVSVPEVMPETEGMGTSL